MICTEKIAQQASRKPDALAVTYGTESLTYAELDLRVTQLSRRLQNRGVDFGDRVAIALDRSVDLIVGILGILRAGATYVPLDPEHPPARTEVILSAADVALLLTERRLLGGFPQLHCPIHCIADESNVPDNARSEEKSRIPCPTDVAYVIFTSGSSGKPKGVEVTHGALSRVFEAVSQRIGLQEDDTLLAVTTPSFDIATLELLLPLTLGGRVAIATSSAVRDGRLLDIELEQTGATFMQATPSTWRMLVQAGWRGKCDLTILCGGDTLHRELADALVLRGKTVWNLYGPTETTIWATAHQVKSEAGTVPIGFPLESAFVYLLDRYGEEVPVGVVGELCIGGSAVARGYLNEPEITAERFRLYPYGNESGHKTDRVYHTGDLGRSRPDGTIEFMGRTDQQVKLRGYRIELEEIESTLMRQSGIANAAVALYQPHNGESCLVAYVVRNGAVPLPERLRDAIRESLPHYMVPAIFVILDALPQNAHGKLDRSALPPPEPVMEAERRRYVPAESTRERALVNCWERVLDRRPISITDHFLELGGHSMAAVRLAATIQEVCGEVISVTEILRAGTIRRLACVMSDAARQEVREQEAATKPPLFFFDPDLTHDGMMSAMLAAYLDVEQELFSVEARLATGEPALTVHSALPQALDRVRERQPLGPYRLSGFCNGGCLAIEVARVLRSQGEEIELLVLAHTPYPYPSPARLAHWLFRTLDPGLKLDDERRYVIYTTLRYLLRSSRRMPQILFDRPSGFLRAWFHRYSQSMGDTAPPNEGKTKHLTQLAYAVRQAGRANSRLVLWRIAEYMPRPYEGHALLIKGSDEGWWWKLSMRRWSSMIADLEVIEMPGSYERIAEHVQDLGEALAMLLARVDSISSLESASPK